MNDLNIMLNVYKSGLSNKIKNLASPLDVYLGLDKFIYTYISNDGSFFTFSNQPETSEFYFHSKLYLSNILIGHPDNFSNGPLLPKSKFHKIEHLHMQKKFGYSVDNSCVIYKKESQGMHKFLFNTKREKECFASFYLTHLNVLNAFTENFLEQLLLHKSMIEKYTINLIPLIGQKFYNPGNQSDDKEILNKKLFLEKTGLVCKDLFIPKKFSYQERACINLLLHGKSYKEVADHLGLSYRTVEHYFENIKNKMNCFTKSDLIEQLRQLKLIGYI